MKIGKEINIRINSVFKNELELYNVVKEKVHLEERLKIIRGTLGNVKVRRLMTLKNTII